MDMVDMGEAEDVKQVCHVAVAGAARLHLLVALEEDILIRK